MKNSMEIQKRSVREPAVRNWLCYELTEDDFLLGKTPKFSYDAWEDEE